MAILRDFQRAQDVTQETFLEAFFSLSRLQEPAALGGWLRSIARHRCHRVLRSRDLELLPPETVDDLWLSDHASPAHQAELGENRQMIASLLRRLPPNERNAAMLFYVKQCSQREAAAFLGIQISTLNNRLHSARTLLRERMTNMKNPLYKTPAAADFAASIGTIIGGCGPIIDARFDDQTPDIFDALWQPMHDGRAVERMKVVQRLDDGRVRCIATGAVDSLRPGMNVLNSGEVGVGITPWVSITPVADDDLEPAVKMLNESTPPTPTLLETGIKPIDLFSPLVQGANVALLGTQGIGRIVLVEELMHRLGTANNHLRIIYLVENNEPDSVRGMLTKEKEYPGDVVGDVQTWWVLTDKAVDPEATEQMRLFDAILYCSPLLAVQGLYPAIDPLASRSRMLTEQFVGREHLDIANRARNVLQQARGLMVDPVLLEHLACHSKKKAWQQAKDFVPRRLAELSESDRLLVQRARKLERFLSTPFFVAEPFSKRTGKFVSRAQTIAGCRAILDGEMDSVPEEAFMYIGSIEEAAK